MAATWSLLCLRYVFMFLCFGFHVWSTVFFLLHPPLNLRKRLLRLPDPHSPPFSSFRFRNPIPISLRAAGSWDPHLSAPLERSSSVYQPPPPPPMPLVLIFLFLRLPPGAAVQRHTFPANPAVTSRSSGSGKRWELCALQISPPRRASPSPSPRITTQPRPSLLLSDR